MKNLIPTNSKKNINNFPIKVFKNINPIEPKKEVVLKVNPIEPKKEVVSKVNPIEPKKEVILKVNPIEPKKEVVLKVNPIEPKKESKKISEELKKRREMGQFYTTSLVLHEKILEFIKNNPDTILEPSVGRGDLILPVRLKYPNVKYDLYELDSGLDSKVDGINYCNFLEKKIDRLYDTIVGNPPFVKTKKGNLAIDFVRKCFGLLDTNGELIFVVPADFFKLTSTGKLISEMMEIGTFTDIFHPKEDNLFEGASINVMLFRYCKNPKLPKECFYNGARKLIMNNNGLLIFVDELDKKVKTFEDYFNIYVGLVSGRDEIYKNEIGNIDVLVSKDEYEKFIYTKVFPSGRKDIDEYLEKNKKELLDRKIRKFNEDNWFEWGAPRNVGIMEGQKGKKCIYVYNLTRKEKVAFIGEVGYFGGNLLVMIPKEGIDLEKVVDYINGMEFRKNYLYGGRFKIGHRQLSNAIIVYTF